MNASDISRFIPEIFGLIIRIAGLTLALSGINQIYRAVIMFVPNISLGSLLSLLFGIPVLIVGIWLLRGAPWLLSFSYPQHQIKES